MNYTLTPALAAIRDRCRIDENGHWLWSGALSEGKYPRVWAVDHTRGGATSQNGRRAVWHVRTGKPIPLGWRVYSTCGEELCLNPDHMRCTSTADFGKFNAKRGHFRNQTARIVANRKTARSRSTLTPDLIAEIMRSPENGPTVAKRLGLSKTVVSNVRTGRARAFEPIGGLFSGLLAMNDTSTRRAG